MASREATPSLLAARAEVSRGRRRRLDADRVALIACIVPAVLAVVALQVAPLVRSAWLSTQHWSLLESPHPLGFIGFGNFSSVLHDPVFWGAARTSAVITGSSVTIELLLGTALAYLVLGDTKSKRVMRTVLVLPMVIAPVAAGTIWRMLLNSESGPVDYGLSLVGVHGPQWLSDPTWAVVGLVLVDVWQWTPFVMLVVAAGALAISGDVIEAAKVDGANRWQIFRRVELPLLAPILLLVAMFRLLDSLLSLDSVYSLTYGGPGHATFTLTYYIYTLGLNSFALGQSAAASWLFMALVALIIAVVFRLQRRTAQI